MLRNDEVNIKRMLLMAEFEPMPREITEKIELAERLLANRSQERTYAFRELSLVLALMDALTIVENARQVRIGEVEAVLKDKRPWPWNSPQQAFIPKPHILSPSPRTPRCPGNWTGELYWKMCYTMSQKAKVSA